MAKKSIYRQFPAVSKKKISETNPVGKVTLGAETSRIVPVGTQGLHGLDLPTKTFKMPSIRGQTKYGNVAKLKK